MNSLTLFFPFYGRAGLILIRIWNVWRIFRMQRDWLFPPQCLASPYSRRFHVRVDRHPGGWGHTSHPRVVVVVVDEDGPGGRGQGSVQQCGNETLPGSDFSWEIYSKVTATCCQWRKTFHTAATHDKTVIHSIRRIPQYHNTPR